MPTPSPAAPCVLVVDDEELILSFLSCALTEYGYRVRAFRSANHAPGSPRRQARRAGSALIDLGHGRKDFLNLRQRYPHVPFILMISDLEEGEDRELHQLGPTPSCKSPSHFRPCWMSFARCAISAARKPMCPSRCHNPF